MPAQENIQEEPHHLCRNFKRHRLRVHLTLDAVAKSTGIVPSLSQMLESGTAPENFDVQQFLHSACFLRTST